MMDRVLQELQPFLGLLPEVAKPKRKVALHERLLWTLGALLIYFACSQLPLYGTLAVGDAALSLFSPFALLARHRSFLEVGVSAILNSGMLTNSFSGQLGFGGQEDLNKAIQKLCCAILTVILSWVNIYMGAYGAAKELGQLRCMMIFAQLVAGGALMISLDDLLQKGYAISTSGISLFLAASTCERIMWAAFSPLRIPPGVGGDDAEYQGALIQLAMTLSNLPWRSNRLDALRVALFRGNAYNVMNVLATVAMFALLIYLQGFRIEIPIQSSRGPTMKSTYPIKLFYTSSMPIMLQSLATNQLFNGARWLASLYPTSRLVKLVGIWRIDGGAAYPIGGLCYYMSPPRSIYYALTDPIQAVLYANFALVSCGYASVLWSSISGSTPKDVAQKFRENQLAIKGHRQSSTVHELNRYIPTATLMGGICVGAITMLGDVLGAIGSGTGILLAVSTIQQLWEEIVKEGFEMMWLS